MVKDNVVVLADWFVAIIALDIWELVMFPLIVRSTVAPLAVVTGTVVANGVGEGDGAGVGVGVGTGVWVGVSANVAVIVPVPLIAAVAEAELALLKVIDPVLDDQEEKV
jgi:hypothetical protein